MIVATAGHVDHGKTSLVRALTGIDTDRLPEEKRRNLTIDLGFAYLPLEGGGVLGFVDVPGHERFIRNMLCGVAAIDYALLVVAADDGVMPQTEEHMAILDLLDVGAGAVAITKTDRVDPDRVAEVAEEVEIYLDETRLAGAPVFPVSSADGSGVDALKTHLATVADTIGRRPADGHFRLAVDRVVHGRRRRPRRHRNRVLGERVGRRSAPALSGANTGARAGYPRPGPQGGERKGGRAAGAQHRGPVAGQGRRRARRLDSGGSRAPARAADRRDRSYPGRRVPAGRALDPGACPSRRRRRHGATRAARSPVAGARRVRPRPARARPADRRGARRPLRTARPVGDAHHGRRNGGRCAAAGAGTGPAGTARLSEGGGASRMPPPRCKRRWTPPGTRSTW